MSQLPVSINSFIARTLSAPLIFHVPESAKTGHKIGPPLNKLFNTPHFDLHFDIARDLTLFHIDILTGQISIRKQSLNFESGLTVYNLTVGIKYEVYFVGYLYVTVLVDDVIDESPMFSQALYKVNVANKSRKNTKILHFDIIDKDLRDKHFLEIVSVTPDTNVFSLDESSMSVFVDGSEGLNYSTYELTVRATDLAGLSAGTAVLVSTNYQRETLRFEDKTFVSENIIPEKPIFVLYSPMYSSCDIIVGHRHIKIRQNGEGVWEVWLTRKLDYEVTLALNITVACRSLASNTVAIYNHQIVVMDTNDNAPVFPPQQTHYTFAENSKRGSIQIPVEAFDKDSSDLYGSVTRYYLDPPISGFIITYDLKLNEHYITNTHSLDYEQQKEYTLTVLARDAGGLVSTIPLIIHLAVSDQNDHAPVIEEFHSATVSSKYTGPVFQVTAHDEDSVSSTLSYKLYSAQDFITVDSRTGLVSVNAHPGCDALSSVWAGYVLALDEDGRTSAPGKFEIIIEIELDECTITDRTLFEFQVPENLDVSTIVGRTMCEGCISYRLLTQLVPFGVFPETGDIFLTDVIDYESDPHYYNLSLKGFHSDGHEVGMSVAIEILDMNEHFPSLTPPLVDSIVLDASIPVGTVLLSISAEDNDMGAQFGTVTNITIIGPLQSILTLPFIVEKNQNRFYVKTNAILTNQFLSELNFIDVLAVDGGGVASSPHRINTDAKVDESSLEKSRQQKSRFVRQAQNDTEATTSLELTIEFQRRSRSFESIGSSARPFTVIAHENLLPGDFEMLVDLVRDDESACPESFDVLELVLSEVDVPFRVAKNDGSCTFSLVNTIVLDYENQTQSVYYRFNIEAFSDGVRISEITIEVFVVDENEFTPVFDSSSYYVIFSENFIGFLFQAQATDEDGSLEFSRIRYNVSGTNRFDILPDGSVQSIFGFDYEYEEACHYFNITATDDGNLVGVASAEACLEDVNDNCPEFERNEYIVTVKENTAGEGALFNLSAIDYDTRSEFSSVVIYAVETNDSFINDIVSLEGHQLFLGRALDYETGPRQFSFVVSATDAADNQCTTNITVQVVNDNDLAPQFTIEFKQLYIPEETFPIKLPNSPENFLTCFAANDEDGDTLTYFLAVPSTLFELSQEHQGCVLLKHALDFEVARRHEIEVIATDGRHNASTFLVVDVENQNDLALKLDSVYEVDVLEGTYTTNPILVIEVKNPTPGVNYRFTLEEPSEMFHVSFRGWVHLRAELDYETRTSHSLSVAIGDGTSISLLTVNVNVLPANEFPPMFLRTSTSERSMVENTPPGLFQVLLEAIDGDRDSSSPILYEVEYISVGGKPIAEYRADGESLKLPFEVMQPQNGGYTGKLVNSESLDFESDPRQYELAVYANDTVFRSATPFLVTVYLEDVNDHAPVFENASYFVTLPEAEDNFELQISVTDGDGTEQYSLVSSFRLVPISPIDVAIPFYVSSGIIRNIRRFDFERLPNIYTFQFIATDDYELSGSTNVTIEIVDSNEFAPVFEKGLYEVTVPETISVGFEIIQIIATDNDGGSHFSTISYSLQESSTPLIYLPFDINNTTGSVFLKVPVDFDEGDEGGDFFVRAQDAGGLSSLTRVFVSFEDVNDNAPCPLVQSFSTQISENTFYDRPLRRIQVFDIDYYADNPRVVFYMEPTYSAFIVDAAGRLYMSGPLDYEEKPVYNFEIVSSDGIQNCSRTTSIQITVLNLDDNRPLFSPSIYEFNISEALEPGVILNISAFDADPPDNILEYRLIENQFDFPFTVSDDGQVSTTSRFNADDPSQQLVYTFEALAYNQYGQDTQPPGQITIRILDVNDHPPLFDESVYVVELAENTPPQVGNVLLITATDEDRTIEFNTISYVLESRSDFITSTFSIDPLSGEIYLLRALDYETASQLIYSFSVRATDSLHVTRTNATILLTDVNEFSPQFSNSTYDIVVPLVVPLGAPVYTFVATDADGSEAFGLVSRYVLIRDEAVVKGKFPFELSHNGNGTLYSVINTTDYQESRYTFRVMAFDSGNLTSSLVNVVVSFRDFLLDRVQTRHCVKVPENSLPSDPIFDLSSVLHSGKELYSYELVISDFLKLSGTELRLTRMLDFETTLYFEANVRATNRLGNNVTIAITVCAQNVNDNPTEFVDSVANIVLSDENGVGPQLLLELLDRDSGWPTTNLQLPQLPPISCCDRDNFVHTNVSFVISSQNAPFELQLNRTVGYAVLSNTLPVAEMTSCDYSFQVTIVDSDGLSSPSSLDIDVSIRRPPQGPPMFSQPSFTFILSENVREIFSVSANHRSELNACLNRNLTGFEYSILNATEAQPFSIDDNGMLSNTRLLSSENSPGEYMFIVVATNTEGTASSIPVTIFLQDTNEFCPFFNSSRVDVTVTEDTAPGTIVSYHPAIDLDDSELYGQIHYRLVANGYNPFLLYPNGSLYLAEQLDYEAGVTEVILTLQASDGTMDLDPLLGKIIIF